jgi:hypothetical protein
MAEQIPPARDSRLWVGLAVGAIVIVIVALALSGGTDTSSPEAAVKSYFSAVADGDGEEACSIATDEFQDLAVASVIGTPSEGESCEEAVANVPDDARNLIGDLTATTTRTEGDTAVVEVTIESDDFSPDPVRFRTVRGEDGWLLAGLAEENPA